MLDNEDFTSRVREKLLDEDAVDQVREIILAQRGQGVSQQELYDALAGLVPKLRQSGRDAEEDVLFEVMDLLAGWCIPQHRIP
jgi:hypothetical protein